MSQSIFRTKPLAKLLEKGYIKETGKKDLQMNPFIACCGLDCEKCEARLATINNDDSLRKKSRQGMVRTQQSGNHAAANINQFIACETDAKCVYLSR